MYERFALVVGYGPILLHSVPVERDTNMTHLRSIGLWTLFFLITLTGCQSVMRPSPVPGVTSKSRLYSAAVDRLAPVVQPDIDAQQGPQQARVLATHAVGRDVPARILAQPPFDPDGHRMRV